MLFCSLPVVAGIMDAKVSLRHPVELQHFSEQLVSELLTQLIAQEELQLTLYCMYAVLNSWQNKTPVSVIDSLRFY